jgi:hypothetical protein
MILKNKLQLLGNVNRDNEYLFAKKGMKAGQQVNLRYPARFLGRSGETYTPEAYQETSYQLTIRPLQGVDVDLPSTEWTLSLDDVKKRVLDPAAAQLANNIERDCLQIALSQVANTVGAPGTIPNTLKTYNQARALLVKEGFPDDQDQNCLMISPDMQVEIANSVSTVFNPTSTISTIFRKGLMAEAYGWRWYESANLWAQAAGTRLATGGGTLSASPATGATTFAVTGFAAGATVNKGDTFTLAGVNAVNPMNRQSLGYLRQFVVQANVTLAAGAGNLSVLPAIQYGATNAFANVDSAPASNAALVFSQAASAQSMQGVGWSPQAFTWACINQEMPGNTDSVFTATDEETGIQLRFARQWEGRTNNFINRFDVLYAFGVPYPTGAVRVWSLT